MSEPTRSQIEKLVKIRNKSKFASNLQFMIDCKEVGIQPGDLPLAEKLDDGSYRWLLSHGVMFERGGELGYRPEA